VFTHVLDVLVVFKALHSSLSMFLMFLLYLKHSIHLYWCSWCSCCIQSTPFVFIDVLDVLVVFEALHSSVVIFLLYSKHSIRPWFSRSSKFSQISMMYWGEIDITTSLLDTQMCLPVFLLYSKHSISPYDVLDVLVVFKTLLSYPCSWCSCCIQSIPFIPDSLIF